MQFVKEPWRVQRRSACLVSFSAFSVAHHWLGCQELCLESLKRCDQLSLGLASSVAHFRRIE